MKATLSLTHKCNLACRYCYAGQTQKQDMPLTTAQKCIDFVLEYLPAGKHLGLCLFGGEPLLRFDLVREITAYAIKKATEIGKQVGTSITTNGTLVTPEVLDFAIDHNMALCFSFDGPRDVHNRNRTYRNGEGSFDDVFKRLEHALKQLGTVEVNAVFGPDTLNDLPRTLEFFVDHGIPVINFNPDIMAVWPDSLIPCLEDIYTQIADYYIGCYSKGREIAINLLDAKMLLFIKGGYAAEDRCSMGDGEWGFAPSGNTYPCERFIGEDEESPFCLGNINSGIDQSCRCALRHKRGNNNLACSCCAMQKYCMSWCGCTNFFMSGQTDIPAPILCSMEKAAISSAKHVFDSLVQSENQLFTDHLYGYVNAGIHHR